MTGSGNVLSGIVLHEIFLTLLVFTLAIHLQNGSAGDETVQIPVSTAGMSSNAHTPAATNNILGKNSEAGMMKKNLLPSFAAVFAGQPEQAGQTESMQDEKLPADAKSARAAMDIDEALVLESLADASSSMRELPGHHLPVKETKAEAEQASSAPATKESKRSRYYSAMSISPGMPEGKKQTNVLQENVSVAPVLIAAQVTTPKQEIAHRTGEWGPELSTSNSEYQVTAHIASHAEVVPPQDAHQSTIPKQPAEGSITWNPQRASVDDSSTDIPVSGNHPMQHADVQANLAFSVEASSSNPVQNISIEEVRVQKVSLQTIQGKPKVEEKSIHGIGQLSSAPAGTHIGDVTRLTSELVPAIPVGRPEAVVDTRTRPDSKSFETEGPFQRLDSGEAPILLHSSTHSIAVGIHDPALGWLEVQTQNSSGHLNATLTAASTEAHANLAADAPAITQYLADRNISVHSLHVGEQSSMGGGSGAQTDSGNSRQQTSEQKTVYAEHNQPPVGQTIAAASGIATAYTNSRISIRA